MTKKRIGLALSGGGARGFAHVGVIKVLAEHNVQIDMIAGTSAGSIVGGAMAAGMSPFEIETMADSITWSKVTRPAYSARAMLSTVPMAGFLEKHLPVSRFEELAIPFAAIALDIATSKRVVLKGKGDLISAIRASSAVPGIFQPITDKDGRLLVDGGLVEPLPALTAREMGADIVIGVDLMACGATFLKHPRTMAGMLIRSAMLLVRAASASQHMHVDVRIEPQIAHIRPDRLRDRKECLELGEAAARTMIPEIERALA